MEGQLIVVFAASFVAVFAMIVVIELGGRPSVVDVALSEVTMTRFRAVRPVLERLKITEAAIEAESMSSCHFGYTVSPNSELLDNSPPDTASVRQYVSQQLQIDLSGVIVGYRDVTRSDFAFSTCADNEIKLPMRSLIISIRLENGAWLSAEVHPHEWHYSELASLWLRYAAIFLLVGGVAIFFVRRIGGPLRRLTAATQRFGQGLEAEELPEAGPPDVADAIRSFNLMQHRVKTEVEHRMKTLAAISHDIRSPLTSLRLKSEFIEDSELRSSLVKSIAKMEQITASALDLLRADDRNESARQVNLAHLIRGECEDYQQGGVNVRYHGPINLEFRLRPILVIRAFRNLIDNANQHADSADVELHRRSDTVVIRVIDNARVSPREILRKHWNHLNDSLMPVIRMKVASG